MIHVYVEYTYIYPIEDMGNLPALRHLTPASE